MTLATALGHRYSIPATPVRLHLDNDPVRAAAPIEDALTVFPKVAGRTLHERPLLPHGGRLRSPDSAAVGMRACRWVSPERSDK